MQLHAFRLNQHGLARLFGELETKVLNIVWALGEPTVQDVVDRLGEPTNYKTIMTVMNRLVDKHFLERHKVSRAFVYRARWTREEMVTRLSRQVLDGLIADFGPMVMVQFVDSVAETDRRRLTELARLVGDKLTGENAHE